MCVGGPHKHATKIAVMKVSDVEVVSFGPELLLFIYKCCFLSFFCARKLRKAAQIRTNRTSVNIPAGPEVVPLPTQI